MLHRQLRSHLILAPTTSIGKSIISTALIIASASLGERVDYLKPIATRSLDEDDEAHIKHFAPSSVTAKSLYTFDEPISPHLAVERQRLKGEVTAIPSDHQFATNVARHVNDFARSLRQTERGVVYIESAGGVHSPSLSGSSPLDLYRPLLPSTLLVGSHELGGISTTISAYESMLVRGYSVDSIIVFKEEYYANWEYFKRYFEEERGIHVGVIPSPPPARASSLSADQLAMKSYYASITPASRDIVSHLQSSHTKRITELEGMAEKSLDVFWWPFVQHGSIKGKEEIMVIDSASGDLFSVYKGLDSVESSSAVTAASSNSASSSSLSTSPPPPTLAPASASTCLLTPTFDGSASWWTQAIGHASAELSLAAAHAAGRYGHILFPTATSVPSLSLATKLIASIGKSWASRVFYSDDGSTAMEIGLKMALRAFAVRFSLSKRNSKRLGVLGLKGSYHGDTIGAMDACEGGVFNEASEWYEGRGFWLDPPVVLFEQGEIRIRKNAERGEVEGVYANLRQVYDVEQRLKDQDPLVEVYTKRIKDDITERYTRADKMRFGVLVIEPIVMGAGGMIFVDPLYQRLLIDIVRTDRDLFPDTIPASSSSSAAAPTTTTTNKEWSGLPIIFDEVFTGLRRLGPLCPSTLLGTSVHPDISCYAKILTGGLVPLAVTLSSDSIFRAFWSEKKVEALLHGHSYSAHPIGCSVALKALEIMDGLETKGIFNAAKDDWSPPALTNANEMSSPEQMQTQETIGWSLWSPEFILEVSRLKNVEAVMTLGTVLAIHLAPLSSSTTGYTSNRSASFLTALREGSGNGENDEIKIHARPLGDIIYFMTSLNTTREVIGRVEGRLINVLSQ